MATGKNKLTRFARVYMGGIDLSGDIRKFDRLENSVDPVDMTGLSDEVVNYLAERRKVGVYGFQAFLNDTATTGASSVMATAPINHVLSVFLGGGAAPAAGDMAYILPSVQMSDATEFSAMVGMLSTDLLASAGSISVSTNPVGVVLFPLTAISATTSGTSIDNGAATTAGGHATLHVTATSIGDYALLIQQSTSGAWAGEETTLLTFTSTAGSVTGEWQAVTGSVARYLRARLVKTAGTMSGAMAFARN